MYEIRVTHEAQREIRALRSFERTRILDAIEVSLRHDPTRETRNRKRLDPRPELSRLGPLWELRVDTYRVFYRVFADEILVLVIKVVKKSRKATKEIL
jgi:mRNA-degrading endonuclease RelE of RelBE toxin-antitoxin system